MVLSDLSLHDVHFPYEKDPVLDGVSLKVKPGEKVAFLGTSRVGKSTLANLLARLWESSSGSMWLGKVDLQPSILKS